MYCANCGTQAPENSRFCPHCGVSLTQSHLPPAIPFSPIAPKKRRSVIIPLFLIGLMGMCLLCVLGVGAAVWFAPDFVETVVLPALEPYATVQVDNDNAPVSVPIASEDSVTRVIGAAGGELVCASGARVIVPAAVLETDTPVHLTRFNGAYELPEMYLASPAGNAYEITLDTDTALPQPIEVVLPFEPQSGIDPGLYTIYRFDGEQWWDLGGFVEGSTIRAYTLQTSVFQPAIGYTIYRSVGFNNYGPYYATVRAWTFIPENSRTPAPPPGGSCTANPPTSPGGPVGFSPSHHLSLPLGSYTFCIQWTDGQDRDEDQYFDYYHYIYPGDTRIAVTADIPTSLDLVPHFDIRTSDGVPGTCGVAPLAAAATANATPGVTIPGAGEVTIRLSWNTTDDLDLHVVEPSGEEIFFNHAWSEAGGVLDVDANAACSTTPGTPIENVYWPRGTPPTGSYTVRVHYWGDCDDPGPVTFRLRIMVRGRVVLDETSALSEENDEYVFTFTR